MGLCCTCASAKSIDGDAVDPGKFEEYNTKAKQGDAEGQFYLGVCYAEGQGVRKNAAEAVKWFRKAAEQNHPAAQTCLGACYERGDGVPQDESVAVSWYRKAAALNDPQAQFYLGTRHAAGQGVAKDDTEAAKWYRKAADQGFANAQYNLGFCYQWGKGVVLDEVEKVRWWRNAAEQNLAPAQASLGACFADGKGVAKDEAEALKWFRKAAAQNDASAEYNLGIFYAEGRAVAKDDIEAVKWYRKAAEQSYPLAQYFLGFCYSNGRGVEKDGVEAYKWILLAAAQGDATAKQSLRVLEPKLTQQQRAEGQQRANTFELPDDPPSDTIQAMLDESGNRPPADLLAKAASGDPTAQNELGEAFQAGKLGVGKIPVAAVKWFKQAAARNHPAAQASLGVCYERGDGVGVLKSVGPDIDKILDTMRFFGNKYPYILNGYGRKDSTLSIMGANIYPEDFESIVYSDPLLARFVHSFAMSLAEDARGNPRPCFDFELADLGQRSGIEVVLKRILLLGLAGLSRDYKKAREEYAESVEPTSGHSA